MLRSQGGDLKTGVSRFGTGAPPQKVADSPRPLSRRLPNCHIAKSSPRPPINHLVQRPTGPFPGLFRVGKNGQRSTRPRPAHSSGPFPPVSGTAGPSRCAPDSDRLALLGAAAGSGIGLVARRVAELADGLDCQQARKESPACFAPMRLHPGQWPRNHGRQGCRGQAGKGMGLCAVGRHILHLLHLVVRLRCCFRAVVV